jgi:N6-L-threonylcarbamoyladenine synthase
MINSGDLDFSFSGLKTAVMNEAGKLGVSGRQDAQSIADLAAAFEASVVAVLVAKCVRALTKSGMSRLVVSGGVGANTRLRRELMAAVSKNRAEVFFPPLQFCTDNGAMIAFAAALRLGAFPHIAYRQQSFGVKPRWELASV